MLSPTSLPRARFVRAEQQLWNHPQTHIDELRRYLWAPVNSDLANEPASVGLSQSQRKLVLAGSDPLVADLMLSLDLLDDAIVVLHEDGRIIHCNHTAAALAKPLKATAINSLQMLGPGEPWAACRQILHEYQVNPSCPERDIHDPGTGIYWALRLTALPYLGVLPRRLVLVIRDVTAAVHARKRLQERELMAATGALLAGAAHQAKNAIFGLSATLDAFEEHTKNGADHDHYFDNLRAGITRMQTLMRDLLDYANPSTCQEEAVSMAAVVRRSAGECAALAERMKVELVLHLAEDGEVMANPLRLVRALENLIENAVQYSQTGGEVTVRLSHARVGARALLRCDIGDQGPGFPPEHMERLGTPFFTMRPGGTGLGLTIAKRILEDAGGMMRLANGAAGGAQVATFLPRSAETVSQLRNPRTEKECGAK